MVYLYLEVMNPVVPNNNFKTILTSINLWFLILKEVKVCANGQKSH